MTDLLERPAETRRSRTGSGWGPALRIARRELLRARARTLVVLLMVLLPVTGVVGLDTLLRTGDISPQESLPAELGTAEARLDLFADGGPVRQSPDARTLAPGPGRGQPADERALQAVLPPGSRLLLVRESGGAQQGFRAPDGRVLRAGLVGVDLRDEATRGPYVVRSGRAPATAGEVAVTSDLAGLGLRPGTPLVLPDGRPGRVTGTVAVPPSSGGDQVVVGLPAAVGLQDAPVVRVLVSGAEVPWSDVLELNALGVSVLSRAVLRDPPPDSEVPDLASYDQRATTAAVIGLIVVMAVLEVVLLAGPAFAVGARRSRRALALLAATGGEPRHVRRVVLAQGLLVGGTAAVLGVVLGVGLAAAARAPLTRWTGAQWGPFEVSVRDVVLLALLGASTAVLAALLPARLAAREPVVASLRGRRATGARTARATAAGLALLVVGLLMCLASLAAPSPELLIAFSALPTVLGAVLLAPLLLRVLGRSAARLPLPLRYAVRDADRQRARTAPAVAAVAATVAAAVALGTAAGSDARQQRDSFSPSRPPGAAVVSGFGGGTPIDWLAVEAAVRRALPGEDVLRVQGLALEQRTDDGSYEDVQLCRPDAPVAVFCEGLLPAYGGDLGSSVLVGQDALDAVAPLLAQGSRPAARRALEDGAVVTFGIPDRAVDVRRQRVLEDPDGRRPAVEVAAEVTAPVVSVRVLDATPPALAVVGDDLAERLGGARTVSLVVGDDLTRAQEDRLRDEVSLVDSGVFTSVERGPEDERDNLPLLLLVLGAGTLVLAGTFAATSLALVEAQPDFAVLGQVGARPRTRRTVAGAYAAVLALAGGVLGVLAGLVPGVTAALALTRTRSDVPGAPGDPVPSAWAHVTVPWELLAAVLVLLPLLAGALAALTARSTPASAAVRRTT